MSWFKRYTPYTLQNVFYSKQLKKIQIGHKPLCEFASDPVDFEPIYKTKEVYYKTEVYAKYRIKTNWPKYKTMISEITEMEYLLKTN